MKMCKARKAKQKKHKKPGDYELWAFKRACQEADIAAMKSGRLTQDQLSWFSGGKARAMRILDPDYE